MPNRILKYEGTHGNYEAELLEEGTGKVIFRTVNSLDPEEITVPLALIQTCARRFVPPHLIRIDGRRTHMSNLADLIEPMPGKIAVQVDTKDEITPAGLYIPESTARTIHEMRPTQGIIVAIGAELEDDEDAMMEPDLPVKIGDRIIFGKYSGTELKYRPPDNADGSRPGTEKIILLVFKDILAKIKNPEDGDKIKVKG